MSIIRGKSAASKLGKRLRAGNTKIEPPPPAPTATTKIEQSTPRRRPRAGWGN